MLSLDEEFTLLTKGAHDLVEKKDFRAKLARARKEGKPLTVKVGFDPSAPDIHLGHTVILRKMRQFQESGHRVIFLIGDFTGLIGDPSGKKSTRPQLSRREIEENAQTYAQQCYKILDREKTEIRYNTEWFLGGGPEKFPPLGADGFVRLASRMTVARVLERDDFQRRWNARQPISLHELMYPLSQAFDSVALKADVELGGTDQLFNLLVGRDLMREEGLEPQVVMTLPLLVGTDGVEKMSKSLGNAIGVNEPPGQMYGKVMSLPDEAIWSYRLLLTDDLPEQIEAARAQVGSGVRHPMQVKKDLARGIVTNFYGAETARRAEEEFERKFSQREVAPADFPEIVLEVQETPSTVPKILVEAGLCDSLRQARRLVDQGAVEWNGARVPAGSAAEFSRDSASEYFVRAGKHKFARIRFR